MVGWAKVCLFVCLFVIFHDISMKLIRTLCGRPYRRGENIIWLSLSCVNPIDVFRWPQTYHCNLRHSYFTPETTRYTQEGEEPERGRERKGEGGGAGEVTEGAGMVEGTGGGEEGEEEEGGERRGEEGEKKRKKRKETKKDVEKEREKEEERSG